VHATPPAPSTPLLPGSGLQPHGSTSKSPTAADLVKTTHAGTWRDAEGRVVVGIRFAIAPKWHIYWINSGEGGMATRIESIVPEGWSSAATIYARPDVIRYDDVVSFGYDEHALLLVPLSAGKTAAAGSATFAANYLVCHDICMMGSGRVTIELPAPEAIGELPLLPQVVEGRSLPRPLASVGGKAVLEDEGKRLVVRGPWPIPATASEGTQPSSPPAAPPADIRFLPFAYPGFTLPDAHYGTGRVAGNAYEMAVGIDLEPNDAPGQVLAAGGLMTFGPKRDDPCFDFRIEVSRPSDRE